MLNYSIGVSEILIFVNLGAIIDKSVLFYTVPIREVFWTVRLVRSGRLSIKVSRGISINSKVVKGFCSIPKY